MARKALETFAEKYFEYFIALLPPWEKRENVNSESARGG